MLSDQTGQKPSKSNCKKVPSNVKSTKLKKTVVQNPRKKVKDPNHVKSKTSKEDRDIVRKLVHIPKLDDQVNHEIQEVETCNEEVKLDELYPLKTRRKLSLSQLRSLIKMPNLPEREALKMIDFLQEFALLLLTRKTCKI